MAKTLNPKEHMPTNNNANENQVGNFRVYNGTFFPTEEVNTRLGIRRSLEILGIPVRGQS